MTFFSRKHLRLLLLPALLLLTGCAGSAKETADSTENEKLSAVATIFPQYDFLRAIGGDHLDLHMLLSPGIGIAADVDEEIAFGNCDHIARCRLK